MVEESSTYKVEVERDSEALSRPDELEWWEKQLGLALPPPVYTGLVTTGR